jgi:hypothetical protein
VARDSEQVRDLPKSPSYCPDDLAYAPIAAALLTVYCLVLRDRHSLAAPVLAGIGWLSEAAWHGYESLQAIIPGLNLIAISLAFFAVAIIISLGKAGLLSKWVERWYGSVPNLPRFRVAIETSVTGNDVSSAESLSDS